MTFLGFQNLKDAIFCSSIPFSSLTTYCATMISALKTSSPLLLVVAVQVLLVLHHQIGSSNAASSNTIQQGQTLKDYDALVSPNGLFRLGFYGAGPLNSRYLAISFNAGYVAGAINVNPVWIANRNTLLSDSTGLLSLDHNGTLKLENADHSVSIVFYSSDPDQVSRINSNNSLVTATLLDSGNLVLVEKNLSSGHERLLWQSFDYPTDAFLPGMRLSINRKTGQIKSLTSRLSDKVPCSGAFTLGVSTVSNASELVIQRRGVTYWRSGVWTGRGFSSPYTLMNLNDPQYTFSYSVGEEKYFSYSKKTESADIMVWVLSEIGQLQKYTVWVSGGMSGPVTVIQCGTRNGNASAAGCETPELPSCRSRLVQFRPRRGTMASNASAMVTPRGAVDLNVSTSDCEVECRRNCSCVAYAPVSPIDHVGCYFWFKGSQFIRDEKLDNVVFFLPNHRG
ncbi:hypothetical protein Sjap_021256 [Stephania japonica]|uniref:Bulb-type lectin domain-containing protein n=1 Tax=Stephania japonica TaxID=461633 RepID=A0AAP0HRC4_9MAGN